MHTLSPPPLEDMLIDSREWGREGKRERNINGREKHQVVASCTWWDWNWDQTHNLGMCPDRESNLQRFGFGDDAQINWATPARAIVFFFKFRIFKKFYLSVFREMGREGEWEGEKHLCVKDTLTGCLSHTPNQGPGPQLRNVPWLGIEPVTLQFAGWHSIHWATPVRILTLIFYWADFLISRKCN